MSATSSHVPLSRQAADWLVGCALPTRVANFALPPFPSDELDAIVQAAEMHGIGPACVRGLRGVATGTPFETLHSRLGYQAAQELMLVHHGHAVVNALNAIGVDAMIIKGPVFSRRLYQSDGSRTFTDIDILIRPDCRDAATQLMRERGYTLHEPEYRAEQKYYEDQWSLSEPTHIPIEIHGNLVHNPRLRAAMSVTYDDVVAAGAGDSEDATALLLVAAVHGAVSHQFDRLQHLVDVALAAEGRAGPIDVDRLKGIAAATGTTTAAYAALSIAGNVLSMPICHSVAAELRPNHIDRLAAQLISRPAVLEAKSNARFANSWRRKVFRQLLRLNRHSKS